MLIIPLEMLGDPHESGRQQKRFGPRRSSFPSEDDERQPITQLFLANAEVFIICHWLVISHI